MTVMADSISTGKDSTRILIVDDDPRTRFVLRLVLERQGYLVREASDGGKALEMLEADPLPDVVTADLMMPNVSGFELIERLRSEPRTVAIPIVVVTSDPDAAQRLSSSGMVDAIVSKPFTASDLTQGIHDVKDRKMRQAS